MIERKISRPKIYNDWGHTKYTRACAIAILVISVAYVLKLPSGGSSLSYDSFRYLAGADSIVASGTYLDISGAPQSHWPPGTSIVYAVAAYLSHRPPEELVKFINLAALLLMAGSLWTIIEITIERWWIAIISFASIFLNTAILSLQNKLWSDPLALGTSTAAMASAIIACRGDKNWFRWMCVASIFLSIAICIRFAMLPGIPILAAVAFGLSKKSESHREAIIVPFLSPLLTLISFYVLRSSTAYSHTLSFRSFNSIVATVSSPDFFMQFWPSLVPLADQVFPVALLATGLSVIVVIIGLIVAPASVAFMRPQQRDALLICIGYVLLSFIFLLTVPAISTFSIEMEFRYLLPIYPFIVLGSAIAADFLLNQQKLYAPILGLFVIGLLSIAAARSSRAAAVQLWSESYSSDSCPSRMALLNDLRRISIPQSPAAVLTNSQGLAWYAMRVAAVPLTRTALKDAPIGTIVIFARPGNTCADIVEAKDFSEIALAHTSDVGIIFSTDRILIGRKQ